MKTLVIFGAARQKGHTKQMVDLFLEHLDGEKEIIDAYRTDVKPCMDCRYCWKTKACAIKDGMQEIYQKIENGKAKLIIGTHALIQENVNYKNLALVITDEQHRFGVHQREDFRHTFQNLFHLHL